jgi:DNA-binding FadR family transcriptional regulator
MPVRTKISKTPNARERRRSLRIHGAIARDLGILIVSGRYAAGETLHTEIAASERLNVSRTAYREAVRILGAKGLVETRPKSGTRVNPPDRWHLLDPDVLSWIFAFEPADTMIASLFELRKIVEPEAAALAATRRTAEQLARMSDALDGMAIHTLETEAGRAADQDFHYALLEASGNPFLITLTTGVTAAVAWTTIFKQRNSPLPRNPVPDHCKVHDAIARGDKEAARAAMAELVELAFQDTQRSREPATSSTPAAGTQPN